MSDQTVDAFPEYAIQIENLKKTYAGNRKAVPKEALMGVSLNVKRGSIFGLLGPNGAGKSTIINIMAGLTMKSSGNVKIWDIDIDKDVRNAKAAIGIVPQELIFDAFFSPRDTLDLMAGLYGVPKSERRSMELLKMVGLEDKADAWARSLSGGMKRRLMVAKAMVHNPPILVLDEPTAGVDVELRKQLWENVRELNRKGVTILLTTHYLEEAEELCDEIAIINHGEVIADEPTETLLSRIEGKEIRFRLDRPMDDVGQSLAGFCAESIGKRSVVIRYNPSEVEVGSMIEAIQKAGYGIVDISTDDSDLEDVFIQLTSSKV